MKKAAFLLAAPLAAALFAAGCAPLPVILRYEPQGETSAPVPGRPTVFVTEVRDLSGGPKMRGSGGSGKKATMSDDSMQGVREGLGRELERLGWRVTSSPLEAGATLTSSINKLDAVWEVGGDVPVDGQVVLELKLTGPAGVLWKDKVTGRGRRVIVGANVPGQGPNYALNDALADALRKAGASLETVFGAPASRVASAPRPAEAAPAPAAPARDELELLPAPRPVRRNAHAVVVGIERYREKLPAADFAAGDARLAAEYFKRVLGVPEANVALLVDERASKGDFEKYFERWLPNRVQAGDDVYVYFSGHGAPNPAKGDAYLVPYDGDPTYIEQTGYPLKRLYEQLAKLPAKRVLVAMDSCFSGAGGRSVIAKGARPLVSVKAPATLDAKITVLSASAGDQISNSYQEKGHGLFTYFLLKGLKERGGDFKAVFDYLKPEVAGIARREYNADQDPQWREGK